MGKRSAMFRCLEADCREEFWEWFEWLTREDLLEFAEELTCPECDSQNWELTDSSNFAGGMSSGEAAYPNWMRHARDVFEAKDTLGIDDLEERVDGLEDFAELSSEEKSKALENIEELHNRVTELERKLED